MYKMPALTHNRVKNGFNGGIRKNNASMGTKTARTQGAVGSDSTRSKALVGGIGSRSKHIRAAYKRRIICDGVKNKTVYYTVTVAGGRFVFNNNANLNITFSVGNKYVFDLSHTSNAATGGHPLRFVTDRANEINYNNSTIIGTPGTTGAKVIFEPLESGTVYVFCKTNKIAMGDNYNNGVNGIVVT
jgi:hypothetical protein